MAPVAGGHRNPRWPYAVGSSGLSELQVWEQGALGEAQGMVSTVPSALFPHGPLRAGSESPRQLWDPFCAGQQLERDERSLLNLDALWEREGPSGPETPRNLRSSLLGPHLDRSPARSGVPSLPGHQSPPPSPRACLQEEGAQEWLVGGGTWAQSLGAGGRTGPMTSEEWARGLLLNCFLISSGRVFLPH